MIYWVFTMFNESLPCLLSMEKFWFWTFQRRKIRSFLIPKTDVGWYFLYHGMPCLLITEKNLILNFSEIGSMEFIYPKCWCKMIFTWYFSAFHPWYSRTWGKFFFRYFLMYNLSLTIFLLIWFNDNWLASYLFLYLSLSLLQKL